MIVVNHYAQGAGGSPGGAARWDSSLGLSPILYQNSNRRLRLPGGNTSIAKTARIDSFRATGKLYAEVAVVNMRAGSTESNAGTTTGIGVVKDTFDFTGSNIAGGTSSNRGVGVWPNASSTNSRIYTNGGFATVAGKFWNGQRMMIAADLDAGKIYTGINGAWHNSANIAAGTGAVLTFTPDATTWGIAATPWSAGDGSPSDTEDVILDLYNDSAGCLYLLPSGYAYW